MTSLLHTKKQGLRNDHSNGDHEPGKELILCVWEIVANAGTYKCETIKFALKHGRQQLTRPSILLQGLCTSMPFWSIILPPSAASMNSLHLQCDLIQTTSGSHPAICSLSGPSSLYACLSLSVCLSVCLPVSLGAEIYMGDYCWRVKALPYLNHSINRVLNFLQVKKLDIDPVQAEDRHQQPIPRMERPTFYS